MNIIYFGHDITDATLKKRISSFRDAGAGVMSLTMRRGEKAAVPWDNIDLGRTHNGNFIHRLWALSAAGPRLAPYRAAGEHADIIFARNLDMLALAYLFIRKFGLKAPLVYECLDIHHLMTERGMAGAVLRALERRFVKRVSHIVISSPAFRDEYFGKHHPTHTEFIVLENKVYMKEAMQRPAWRRKRESGSRLKIGWFGILRCDRSLRILTGIADIFPEDIEIVVRGRPALDVLPQFHEMIGTRQNVIYHGPYEAPADLARIHAEVDMIWAGDFFQAGHNSKWLLPNRLYESGAFGVPCLAPADSMTGRRISGQKLGFALVEPLEDEMPELIRAIIDNNSILEKSAEGISEMPRSFFVDDGSEAKNALLRIKSSSPAAGDDFLEVK